MKKLWLIFLTVLVVVSCSSSKYKKTKKDISSILETPFFNNQFTGFILYNPETKDTLYSQQANKYFTPASNTKILTLYSALQLLGDRIPSFNYATTTDTLFIKGNGDPTLLHPFFKDSTLINFLSADKHIALYVNNFKDDAYGPGWAWEDYDSYYSPERSILPLYGNMVSIYKSDSLHTIPSYFLNDVIDIPYKRKRDLQKNTFYFDSKRTDTLEIPFTVDSTLTKTLLSSAADKPISIVNHFPSLSKTIYSVESDSVYKRMMHESDNFIAEQLLFLGASTLSDTISSGITRKFVLENYLQHLPQQPRWVDGSGLSRYNLISPASILYVLNELYKDVPRERLFTIFPAGGESGTLKNWYPGNPEPYIYAKSGSLGNNYCLSGYLITQKGKVLLFSFMNNHYKTPTTALKEKMQVIFESIRDYN